MPQSPSFPPVISSQTMPMHYPEGSYIYVLVCTLDKLSRIPGSKGLPNWSKHWAILVGGFCFEVKRGRDGVKRGQGGVKRGQDGNPDTIRGLPFHEWKRENPNWNKRFIKVGVTTKDWENIVLDSILIWALRFKLEYRLSEQNCQNFAYLLYERIRISKESLREDGFPDEELRTFKRFPRRFTQGVKTLVYDPIKLSLAFDSLGALSVLHPGVAVLGSVITLAVLYKATKDKDRDYVKKRAADMTPEHPDYSEWKEEQSLENLRRVLRRCQGAATFKKKLLDAKQAGKTVRIIDQFQHAKGKMTVDDYNYISEDDLYSDGSDSDFESGFENDPEDFFNTDYGEHHLQRATLHSHEFHPVGQEGDRFRFNNTYGSRPSEQASGNWIDESGELMVVDENNKSEETPQPTAECAGIVDTSGANCPEEWTPWSEWTWDTDQNQWRTICWSLTVQGMYRDEWFDPASSSLDGTSSDERGKSAQHEGRRKGGRTSRGKRDRHRH